MRHRALLATTALLLGALAVGPTATADAPDRPPRTQGSAEDPRGDASGGPRWRHPRADLTGVAYKMPLARQGRLLQIRADFVRFGFGNEPRPEVPIGGAPSQQVKTILDGPGARDWAITVYNTERAPRVVYLGTPSGKPRRVNWEGAFIISGGARGGPGGMVLGITTEWLRGPDRLDLTSTGISGEATDAARTVERLNSRYSGPTGRQAMTRGADGCTRLDDGRTRCTWTNGGLG
ncbi:hypothetical protein [uncultured Nocardioides sp.]|uniref:hypothetical protein n=1 Tax=uncultured Nocardioides sp. TaxID=198441 RepID=UPI00262DF880|nr:hypothetical protein [uncultured Nocardioides sp.]